jgi:hypothetical protein
MTDFQEALAALVHANPNVHANPKPKPKPRGKRRNNPKARKNMAVTLNYQGTDMKFDTPAEAHQFLALTGGRTAGGTTNFEQVGQSQAKKKSRSRGRSRHKRSAQGEPRTVQSPDSPVTYKQAAVIGMSLGGQAAYCPHHAQSQEKVSHKQALEELGLTRGAAAKVLDKLQAEGLARWHRGMPKPSEAQAKRAMGILTQVGGITCPVG